MKDDACCEPAPPDRANPPGQPSVRYRVGTWASFRAAMVARLPLQQVPPGAPTGDRPLAALTSRDPSEPTIALLDAAASVLDVLTFYQERYLNESFLGTAQERGSLVQIARALGYEPGPGASASGHLAFSASPLSVDPVTVPAGTAVMAMPAGNAPPPVFETREDLVALAAYNALPVTRRLPLTPLATGDDHVWVEGAAVRAQPGDAVLLYGTDRLSTPGSERWDFRRLTAIETDPAHAETRLGFERPLGDVGTAPPEQVLAVLIFRTRASLFGHNAPDWKTQSDQTQLTAWWSAGGSMAGVPSTTTDGRTRLLNRTHPGSTAPWPVTEWPGFALADEPGLTEGIVDLDREYPGVLPDSWVVLVGPYEVEACRVRRASPRGRVGFTLSGRVTRLKLEGERLAMFDRRGTTVWCEPEALVRVGEPDDSPVTGATVRVTGAHGALQGRTIAVYGPSAITGSVSGEIVVVVSAAIGDDGITTLTVDPPLAGSYVRDKVIVNANVARATHGQTAPPEVLGSGNNARPFQSFLLRGKPLTHASSSDDPSGVAPELSVRIGGVAWTRVPFLYGQAPGALVYALRHSVDGTEVRFGDGITGARLPGGAENVVASYRTGLGLAGEVASGRASLLTRRPPGIDAALNPAAFTGGADPESPEDIRRNAPTTVLTLDRLVAIEDYQDFARRVAGVGKALAVGIWAGQRRLVHLTVGSASGQPLAATDPLFVDLELTLRRYQDPEHRIAIDSYVPRWFGVDALLLTAPAYRWEDVEAAARAALAATFDFANRGFGQGVTPAEVIGALSSVAGVVAVDLQSIYRTDQPTVAAPPRLLLEALGPQTSGGARQVAELLLVSASASHVQLGRMSP